MTTGQVSRRDRGTRASWKHRTTSRRPIPARGRTRSPRDQGRTSSGAGRNQAVKPSRAWRSGAGSVRQREPPATPVVPAPRPRAAPRCPSHLRGRPAAIDRTPAPLATPEPGAPTARSSRRAESRPGQSSRARAGTRRAVPGPEAPPRRVSNHTTANTWQQRKCRRARCACRGPEAGRAGGPTPAGLGPPESPPERDEPRYRGADDGPGEAAPGGASSSDGPGSRWRGRARRSIPAPRRIAPTPLDGTAGAGGPAGRRSGRFPPVPRDRTRRARGAGWFRPGRPRGGRSGPARCRGDRPARTAGGSGLHGLRSRWRPVPGRPPRHGRGPRAPRPGWQPAAPPRRCPDGCHDPRGPRPARGGARPASGRAGPAGRRSPGHPRWPPAPPGVQPQRAEVVADPGEKLHEIQS